MTTDRSEVWQLAAVLGVGYALTRTAGIRPTWGMVWLAVAVVLWLEALLLPARWARLAVVVGAVAFLVWHVQVMLATPERPRFVPVVMPWW